jgi:hypothetical protein
MSSEAPAVSDVETTDTAAKQAAAAKGKAPAKGSDPTGKEALGKKARLCALRRTGLGA